LKKPQLGIVLTAALAAAGLMAGLLSSCKGAYTDTDAGGQENGRLIINNQPKELVFLYLFPGYEDFKTETALTSHLASPITCLSEGWSPFTLSWYYVHDAVAPFNATGKFCIVIEESDGTYKYMNARFVNGSATVDYNDMIQPTD
jgi:hypothetical protein